MDSLYNVLELSPLSAANSLLCNRFLVSSLLRGDQGPFLSEAEINALEQAAAKRESQQEDDDDDDDDDAKGSGASIAVVQSQRLPLVVPGANQQAAQVSSRAFGARH